MQGSWYLMEGAYLNFVFKPLVSTDPETMQHPEPQMTKCLVLNGKDRESSGAAQIIPGITMAGKERNLQFGIPCLSQRNIKQWSMAQWFLYCHVYQVQ